MNKLFQLLTTPDPYDFVGQQIQLTGKMMVLLFGFLLAFFAGKFNDNLLIALLGGIPIVVIAIYYYRSLKSLAIDDWEARTEYIRRFESSGIARRYQEMAEA